MIPNEKSEEQFSENLELMSEYHMTTNKKIIFGVYLFSLLLFIISVSALLSLAWTPIQEFKLSDQYYYANQVTYYWKQGFITDIQIVASSDCPSGYEHAYTFDWPGTNYGCVCSPSSNVSFVTNGICSANLIERKCKNMERLQAIETHYWKGNSNICIKRSETSFATEQKYNQQNKICGSSSSLVVIPNNQPCPFVNISSSDFTLEQNFRVIEDTDQLLEPLYVAFNATSPYSFFTYPISHFSVSEYEFCLINEDTGLNPDHSDFKLLIKERGCAEKGNYSILNTITENEFYENNPKLKLLTNIQGFPRPNNWNYHLGFASVPSWRYQCRHNMDSKFSITNALYQFNFVFSDQYEITAIIIVVLVAIVCIELLVVIMRRLFHHKIYPIGYKQVNMPGQFCIGVLRYSIGIVCKLGVFIASFLLLYFSIENWNWFKSAINHNCMDGNPQIQEFILAPYSQMYFTVQQFSFAQTVIALFFFIVDIIHFRYIYVNELKHYLIESEDKQMVNAEQPIYLFETQEKDNLLKIDDKLDENDPFRVTMALQVNQKEDIIRKPKKKRKMKELLNEESKVAQGNQGESLFIEENPYMLHEKQLVIEDDLKKQIEEFDRKHKNDDKKRK